MKVLVADDDADLLRSRSRFTLTQAGYLVVKAGDGRDRDSSASRPKSPDLAICSTSTCQALSGFQVCEAIRARSRVPVMMLTVRGEEEDLVRALELGADDYLTKPFSPRTLLARDQGAAAARRAWRAARRSSAGRVQLDLAGVHRADRHRGAGAAHRSSSCACCRCCSRTPATPSSSDRLLMQVWGHRGGGRPAVAEAARAPRCGRRSRPILAAPAAAAHRRGGLQAHRRLTPCVA